MNTRTDGLSRMRLSEWARNEGISRITAYRMLQRGILPVPAERSPTGRWYVLVPQPRVGRSVIYARTSRGPQQGDLLNRQITVASDWATEHRREVHTVVMELANTVTDPLPQLERLLVDVQITEIIIHDPGVLGLGRYALLVAALAPQQRIITAVNPARGVATPVAASSWH